MEPERISHGIRWGSSDITCMFDDKKKKWVTWGLETPKYKGNKAIQIYVTKTGKVRIFDWEGEWTPPNTTDQLESGARNEIKTQEQDDE